MYFETGAFHVAVAFGDDAGNERVAVAVVAAA